MMVWICKQFFNQCRTGKECRIQVRCQNWTILELDDIINLDALMLDIGLRAHLERAGVAHPALSNCLAVVPFQKQPPTIITPRRRACFDSVVGSQCILESNLRQHG